MKRLSFLCLVRHGTVEAGGIYMEGAARRKRNKIWWEDYNLGIECLATTRYDMGLGTGERLKLTRFYQQLITASISCCKERARR